MGQHKYNPTAIAAKEGKLQPKKPRPSKRERDAELNAAVKSALKKVVGVTPDDFLDVNMIGKYY